MAGFTLIHLSDLHIANPVFRAGQSQALSGGGSLGEMVAGKLADDLRRIADQHKVPFLTPETFVVVTGDITHRCEADEFQSAASFLRGLRAAFRAQFPGQEILPEHIICVPGNHDLDLPQWDGNGEPPWSDGAASRYERFKLFLEETTDYAVYAREFRLTDPFIAITEAVPFPVQFVMLNSCAPIRCYSPGSRRKAARAPASVRCDYFTEEQLRLLEARLGEAKGVLRIGLMHHRLTDFPAPGEVSDAVDFDGFSHWLDKRGFCLLLSGHGHKSRSLHTPTFELATGPSFPLRGAESPYQVIRVGPDARPRITVYLRQFKSSDDRHFVENGAWEKKEVSSPEIRRLEGVLHAMGLTGYRSFLGVGEKESWAVVRHCDYRKFEKRGVFPPGDTIHHALLRTFRFRGQCDLLRAGKASRTIPHYPAVFLMDSPHANPHVDAALRNYRTHLAGGQVEFLKSTSPPIMERIRVSHQSEPYRSDKADGQGLFDGYEDYLLVMRLPRHVVLSDSRVERLDFEPDDVIWVVAGIHSKASYAGACLFTPENLQKFTEYLMAQCGGAVPQYFEVVFRVPRTPNEVTGFADLDPVHFSMLRLRREVALADDIAFRVINGFYSKDAWDRIPVDTVHFDPVAACNYRCPHCIEALERGKGIFLSLPACARILCDLQEVDCQRLHFYGGEPTLHPEFPELLRLSTALGYEMLLVTNGSRLGEEEIRETIGRAKQQIRLRVSLDAHSPETYGRMRGGGRFSADFEQARDSAVDLIGSGVPVTISLLMSSFLAAEISDSCRYWQGKGAAAIVLRPMTAVEGKRPVRPSSADRKRFLDALQAHGGFLLTPDWVPEWLSTGKLPDTRKCYPTCYSAFYRMAISPYRESRAASGSAEATREVAMEETGQAWLSLCTYRRYDSRYGCRYPDDLRKWTETERRRMIVMNLRPTQACGGVICCRDGYNLQVHRLLSARNA